MNRIVLKRKIGTIDNGRFKKLIAVFDLFDECSSCAYFNQSVNWGNIYRCYCSPTCIAATLNPNIISYLNWKLNWIEAEEHRKNLGLIK